MGSYKACFLLAAFVAAANANYHYERFKVFNFDGNAEPYQKPWFFDEYASPYTQGGVGNVEAFEAAANTEQKPPEVYENPAEAYFVASTKRVPKEDKNFKKSVSPFYTLTDADNEKYKSIILKSGVPYCQETKSRVPKKRFRRDAMTCYKCKDPKNGATYEQCSYTSEPQATHRVDEYVPLPATFRYRRSNVPAPAAAAAATPTPANYRFSEEYFTPAASDEVPAEYKKKMENCDKVVKDSMVCMVCKDPETNGKYEQCSYTNQPKDKAYAYSKSSSFGGPGDEKKKPAESRTRTTSAKSRADGDKDAEESRESSGPEASGQFEGSQHPEVDKYFDEQVAIIKERKPASSNSNPNYRTYEESEESAKLELGAENVKDADCKKVTKDSMVCMVCKDPKTGGNYEQCSYAYQPNDKVYQFSRQKSFGYPEDGASNAPNKESSRYEAPSYADHADDKAYRQGSGNYYSQPQKDSGDHGDTPVYYDQPTENQESHEYAPYNAGGDEVSDEDKSESEKVSAETKDGDCKTVEKDTMTCRVCKDPKTGGNYEQCSYAYKPNDKVFSFSRAKSFGTPEAEDEAPAEGYTDEGGYGVASDNKPYVANGADEEAGAKESVQLPVDIFSTVAKKKEIEKVLNEFQQEDRSKCKKVMRDKLTCFQCTDKDGMQKEECIFVAAQEPAKDRLTYREVKEFQREPAAASTSLAKSEDTVGKKKRRTKKITSANVYAEPTQAASENQEQRAEHPEAAEVEEEPEVREKDDLEDSEPYDYAAATKPTYDKVLGITLPRYMLTTSEHEAEFDEVVASTKI